MSVHIIDEHDATDDTNILTIVPAEGGEGGVWLSSSSGDEIFVEPDDVPTLIEKLTKLQQKLTAEGA